MLYTFIKRSSRLFFKRAGANTDSRASALVGHRVFGKTHNNNNNNNNHYHKKLGACLIPNGSVYIELPFNFCALFTRLNISTDSPDVMPVTSGSCLSG